MKFTAALNDNATEALEYSDLGSLIKAHSPKSGVKVLKVFGRGQFASLEASEDAISSLRSRIGNLCVFTPTLTARPF